jgi:hypothetical protein
MGIVSRWFGSASSTTQQPPTKTEQAQTMFSGAKNSVCKAGETLANGACSAGKTTLEYAGKIKNSVTPYLTPKVAIAAGAATVTAASYGLYAYMQPEEEQGQLCALTGYYC